MRPLDPDTIRRNQLVVNLIKSTLCRLSDNFVAVMLVTEIDQVVIRIELERESAVSRADIEKIFEQFKHLNTEGVPAAVEVIVGRDPYLSPTGDVIETFVSSRA